MNRGNSEQHEKLSPAEVELASYKKREYLDGVKAELSHYRRKNSDELFRGTPMESSASIFNTPQFGQKKILHKKKPGNILGAGKGGGSLW